MTENEKAALDAAKKFLADSAERRDHAMRYWAYERDAELFATFIVTGKYPKPERSTTP